MAKIYYKVTDGLLVGYIKENGSYYTLFEIEVATLHQSLEEELAYFCEDNGIEYSEFVPLKEYKIIFSMECVLFAEDELSANRIFKEVNHNNLNLDSEVISSKFRDILKIENL